MNTANTRPRFRTDLVAQPLDEGGQRFVDVTDPDSGKTFRFYEIEYSIACAMDGKRDLTGLSQWAQAELGLSPTPDELQTVISTLADLGYLDTPPAAGDDFDLGFAGAGNASDDEEPMPSGGDFELGSAGKSLLAADREEKLEAADISLGLPGEATGEDTFAGMSADEAPTQVKRATSHFGEPPAPPAEEAEVRAVLRPVTPMGHAPADEDDGPTNLPPPARDFDDEMSVDLTDHMKIGTADVQEAIRQSRAMQAVKEPPPAEEAAAPAAAKPAAAAPPPRPKTQPPAPVVATTELPDKPATVSAKEEIAAPQAAAGGSRVPLVIALVVLVLVLGIAGVYFFYLPMLKSQETGAVQPVPAEPAVPEPPPEPELPSARLALADAEPVEVTAPREGTIAEIVEAGQEVAEGDVVIKLDGYQSFEPKIAAFESDQRRYEKRIEDTEAKKAEAEAQGNEAAVKKHQRYIDLHVQKIEDKKQRADAERKEMEAFFIRAPLAGALETELEAKAKLEAEAVVFRIQPPQILQATFSLTGEDAPEPPAEGEEVELAVKEDDAKKVMCEVTKVDGKDVTVTCPRDGDVKEDDEVVLL